jgi:hypothetical protein
MKEGKDKKKKRTTQYVIRSARPAGISSSKMLDTWSRIKYAIGQIFKKESTADLSYEKLYRCVILPISTNASIPYTHTLKKYKQERLQSSSREKGTVRV